jgi:predicted dehydrogenase/threonine dehydrogenase-like Zn-dependent dehydrogenase
MKQVVQAVGTGRLRVIDVPVPLIGSTEVLVATTHTLISTGTERSVRQLASSTLLAKARARPELVRQVVRKARSDGMAQTMRAVRARLDEDMPLGYSGAGIVQEVGEASRGLVPGQRVATAGSGKANHAEFQAVPANLAIPIPDAVGNAEAAFGAIAAIPLHGLRLTELEPGSKTVVIGLGLIGQLAVRIALAAGHEVAAIDLREWTVSRASERGAFGVVERGDETTSAILDWTRGRGADAVIIAAATPSSDPVHRAVAIARDRATLVVLGDVGLHLDRTPLYEKELTIRFARSYGPGRYDRSYEDWAVDYPIGYVRWTEGRNIEAVLDLMASKRLVVDDLITHTFPVEDAEDAYELIERQDAKFLGIQLTYTRSHDHAAAPIVLPRRKSGHGVGLIGAGTFARTVLISSLRDAGFDRLVSVVSAGGVSSAHLARQAGFQRVASNPSTLVTDADVDIVVIATPHDTHAELVTLALEAEKHVFCEKPLALTSDDLARVVTAWRSHHGQLMVGFNRRYAPAVEQVRRHFAGKPGPLLVNYRVNAGELAKDHWYRDRRQGGRIIGEVCHFVDTCNAIVASPVRTVFASGQSQNELLLTEDVVVVLTYEDGSVATIHYAAHGHPRTPKERLDVIGRDHSATVDNFHRLTLDERAVRLPGKDNKGYVAELAAFRQAVGSGTVTSSMTESAFETMAVTFAAIESLRTGRAANPGI